MSTSYSKGQAWGALRKAWKGFNIAKREGNKEAMKLFQERIRNLERQLGLEENAFRERDEKDGGLQS